MKKLAGILLGITMGAALAAGCGSAKEKSGDANTQTETIETSTQAGTEASEQTADTGKTGEKHHVEIQVQDYGTISVELEPEKAPITVGNFLKLAKDGFYDGLTFHRIISGFMIQGGDPLGDGSGGSDETIKGEFSENGVENSLSHTRGAISMARSQDMDSASSQFFIVHEDSTYLDGQYAVFGYVTEGMEIVDKICEDTQTEDSNGTVNAENQPVITSIEVID